jgi:pSer/pThr/pTyr-binding forkhead associated (FHA) protein
MILRFTKPDGAHAEMRLTADPITLGRTPDADIVLNDEKASRRHCGIRFENGRHRLKDLKSKNGTYLNDERIEEAELRPGDRIRIGSLILRVEEEEKPLGSETALCQMQEQMAGGKGYRTILKEIVQSTGSPPNPAPGRDAPPRRHR